MNNFLKEVKTLWKANYKKVNFWVSLISILLIGVLVYAKLVLKIDISAADIAILVSSVGALIVFVGNLLNNKIIVQTGESLDSTKITSATEGISSTVEQLTDEVQKLKTKVEDTKSKVDATQKTVEKVASAVTTDTGSSDTHTTSLGSVIDKDGNIVGTVKTE